MILKNNFSDIRINGAWEYSPFAAGDKVTVLEITQGCPDLGCCDAFYLIKDEWGLNGGQPFEAAKYFDITEVPDWHEWTHEQGTHTPPAKSK